MRSLCVIVVSVIFISRNAFALFGEDIGPLLELVSGQVSEIEQLTQTVGIAKDQTQLLRDLNDGIERSLAQIRSIQDIIDRSQGLDPTSVRSLSDLNDLLGRAKQTKRQIDDLMLMKLMLADQAIAQSALQTDTTYKMGQEMVGVGSQLAVESETASPGRASQISAASGSAQMLAQGVQLQTMAQMVQLQAMSLEFQKTQLQRELKAEQAQSSVFQASLAANAEAKQ